MKFKLKEMTSRSNGWGMEYRKGKLRQFITGWINYFKLADMQMLLREIDGWLRRRLRMVIWKQWKRVVTKMRNLMKLGVEKSQAYQWAYTRKSYWHTAKSFILSTSITTERLREAGYIMLSDQYRKVRIKT